MSIADAGNCAVFVFSETGSVFVEQGLVEHHAVHVTLIPANEAQACWLRLSLVIVFYFLN